MSLNVGGTRGGGAFFFWGVVMAAVGGYLLTSRIAVTTGGWMLWGYNSFGLSLLPFLIGVGLLFFNGKSRFGWLLLAAGLAIVLAGVLLNLTIYFQHTTLFETLLMLALIAGGVGLIARSLRPG